MGSPLERSVYRSRFDDGILDTALGLGYVGLGVALRTEGIAGPGIVSVALLLGGVARPVLIKQWGDYARLRKDRRDQMRRSGQFLSLALAVGLLGGLVYVTREAAVIGALVAVRGLPLFLAASATTAFAGGVFHLPRFLIVGAVGLAMGLLSLWIDIAPEVLFVTIGGVLCLLGVVLFAMFGRGGRLGLGGGE